MNGVGRGHEPPAGSAGGGPRAGKVGAIGRSSAVPLAPTLLPIAGHEAEAPPPIALRVDRTGPYLLEILTAAQFARLGPGQLPELFHKHGPDCYVRMRFDLKAHRRRAD